MRYAALDADGRATGALYDTITPGVVAHHAAYGDTLIEVADLVNAGTDDAPVWKIVAPTLAELRLTMRATRFQARAALHQAGLLSAAEAAVAEAGAMAQIAWADAAEWRRDSPTIAAIATALQLTDQQVDDLFDAAAQITA